MLMLIKLPAGFIETTVIISIHLMLMLIVHDICLYSKNKPISIHLMLMLIEFQQGILIDVC